ncbi:MAG: hypothetical protein U1E10_01535, partial [Bdellovibrionales bacterium]|nr:hypothetical protein [Bdellovibrionales bacterium]
MRNWKSFFKKEDFPIELGDVRAQEVSNRANELLLEALSQAEPVFGRGPYGMAWYVEHAVGALDFDCQRKGRVVDVEDLSEEEFDRHRELLNEIGLERKEPWFDKYDLMIELGETAAIVDALIAQRGTGVTKLPIKELNDGLRGGLREGEVTFIAGSGHLEEVLSVIALTAFQHGQKVLRVTDGGMDHINHDRFPRAIEIFKFSRFDIETIETELRDFIKETHATFVVIDRLDVDGFFFKENRTADDFRKVMNTIRLAA